MNRRRPPSAKLTKVALAVATAVAITVAASAGATSAQERGAPARVSGSDLPALPGTTFAVDLVWEGSGQRLVYLITIGPNGEQGMGRLFHPESGRQWKMWERKVESARGGAFRVLEEDGEVGAEFSVARGTLMVNGQATRMTPVAPNRNVVRVVMRGDGPPRELLEGALAERSPEGLIPWFPGCCGACCYVHCGAGIPCELDVVCCRGNCGLLCHCNCAAGSVVQVMG